jgi:hypothetical protein
MNAPETARALAPEPRHRAPWVEWRTEIQSAGADTIEFSFDVGVSDAMWEVLERERETARVAYAGATLRARPQVAERRDAPTGARGGYCFLLETPDCAIQRQRGLVN